MVTVEGKHIKERAEEEFVAGGVSRKGAGVGNRNSNVRISLLNLSCVLILMHISRSLTSVSVRTQKRSLTRFCFFSWFGLIYNEKTLEHGAAREVGKEGKKEGDMALCCSLCIWLLLSAECFIFTL